jgi:ribosomal protein L16/L10AE
MVKFTIRIQKDKTDKIRILIGHDEISDTLKLSMNYQSYLLTRYIQARHLRGGTTKTRLKRRTGHLARSTVPIIAKEKGGFIIGGTQFGTKYAPVHVGAEDREPVRITPKKAGIKYLAIPLPPALTKVGAKRLVKTRDFPDMEYRKKKGRDPVMGYSSGSGKFTPYFALKKEVTIKTRVFPEAIINMKKEDIRKGIKKDIDELIRKHNG